MGRSRTTAKLDPVNKAEERFEGRMKKYEHYQYQDLQSAPELDLSKYDLDLSKYKQENLLEDMPGMQAYTASADRAAGLFQQSQANIMQGLKRSAGASGAAGLAQAMSGASTKFASGQQVGLGEKAAEARRLGLQESMRLQGQETKMQLAQDVQRRDLRLSEDKTRRDFDYGKMTTLLGVEGERTAGAREMYASQRQADATESAAKSQMYGQIIGAFAPATGSDRKLKKNIKKEGKSPKGLQLYSFEYKDPSDGKGRWQGVIADDLPTSVKNKTVVKSADGYDMVNYSKLDVTLKQV